jgi:BirA family biotin operon repressor/biotin-[acetyl-CoA-carboxylase] ligase
MIGRKITKFDKLNSTNDYIKQHLNTLEHGTIILAAEQTNGRGRFGNTWVSKSGNLYFSLLIKNQEYVDNIFGLHIKISLVLVELLKSYNIDANIKYPNDILVNKKKISGILIETVGYSKSRNIILGVGLNVNQKNFLELKDKATSMNIETNIKYELDTIISDFIDIYNGKYDYKNMYDLYLQKSLMIGLKIMYQGESYIIETIKRNGHIVLKDERSKLVISFEKLTLNEEYYYL